MNNNSKDLDRKFKIIFIILIFLGLGLRITVYLNSIGSNDIRTWNYFAELIDKYGLSESYSKAHILNHPPLVSIFAWLCFRFSLINNISFYYVFKLMPFIADLGNIFLVWKITNHFNKINAVRSTAAYLLSLPAILISCYHGNTDSICIFFIMLTIYFLAVRSNIKSAALALSFAINIKIIPLILIIPIMSTMKVKDLWRFMPIIVLGFIPFILLGFGSDFAFFNNIFLYRSNREPWGINYLLWNNGSRSNSLSVLYIRYATTVIIGLILFLTICQLKLRTFTIIDMITIPIIVFLIFAQGFGIQYLMYAAPLIAISSPIFTALFSVTGGLFALCFYYEYLKNPWPTESFSWSFFPPYTALAGFVAWLTLLCFLYCYLRRIILRNINFSKS